MRQRPVSTIIFGILNIGYAMMKLLGVVMMLVMPHIKGPAATGFTAMNDPGYLALTRFGAVAGGILGVAVLAFGIGLLMLKNWARLGSIVYAVIDIVLAVVMTMLTWPYTQRAMQNIPNAPPGMMQGFAVVGLVIGLVIGVGYPALLLFFMTRDNVIEACQPELPPPPPATA